MTKEDPTPYEHFSDEDLLALPESEQKRIQDIPTLERLVRLYRQELARLELAEMEPKGTANGSMKKPEEAGTVDLVLRINGEVGHA